MIVNLEKMVSKLGCVGRASRSVALVGTLIKSPRIVEECK